LKEFDMAASAGVWVDSERAVIVYLNDPDRTIVKLEASPVVVTDPKMGAKKPAYTKNDFVAEDRLKRKTAAVRTSFHRKLAKQLIGVGQLLILGPGSAKKEFVKHLGIKRTAPAVAKVQACDKLTDRQLRALVEAHFASVGKKGSKTPRKRTTKAASVA